MIGSMSKQVGAGAFVAFCAFLGLADAVWNHKYENILPCTIFIVLGYTSYDISKLERSYEKSPFVETPIEPKYWLNP